MNDRRVEEPANVVVARLRRVISAAAQDCQCRGRLDEALDRYSALDRARRRRTALNGARRAARSIAALIVLLGELDELGDEPWDPTVLPELADLFDSIIVEAETGGALLRGLEDA